MTILKNYEGVVRASQMQPLLTPCIGIKDLLGTTQPIAADDEKTFKGEINKKFIRRHKHLKYKLWPFINLMVIKCNADLLSEGVILVDLPGAFDVSATILRATEVFKDKLQFTLAAARVTRSEADAALISMPHLVDTRHTRLNDSQALWMTK